MIITFVHEGYEYTNVYQINDHLIFRRKVTSCYLDNVQYTSFSFKEQSILTRNITSIKPEFPLTFLIDL